MEGMMKKQSCGVGNGNGHGSGMGMHKDSQIISKVKPKIRIIHIFAPEIIKTDVANFRELVQRLTGKPTDNNSSNNNNGSGGIKRRPRISGGRRKLQEPLIRPLMTKKMEIMRSGFHQYRSSSSSCCCCSSSDDQLRERIKGEEEIWRGANSGGGFLGGFTELEGFMEQLNNEFPLLPMDAPTHVESAAYGQSLQLA